MRMDDFRPTVDPDEYLENPFEAILNTMPSPRPAGGPEWPNRDDFASDEEWFAKADEVLGKPAGETARMLGEARAEIEQITRARRLQDERYGDEWVRGSRVMSEGMIDSDGLKRLRDYLPAYWLRKDETFQDIKTLPGDSVNCALNNPFEWWFKIDDLTFYEKMHFGFSHWFLGHETWATVDELFDHWKGQNAKKLWALIKKKGLRAWFLLPRIGVALLPVGKISKPLLPERLKSECLFRWAEIEEFEKTHPTLLVPDTPRERDIAKVRAYANSRWETNPSLTLKEIAESMHGIQREYPLEGAPYHDPGTFEDWIRDLNPNKGRRGPRKKA